MAGLAFPSQSIFCFIQKFSNYSITCSQFILPKFVFILRFLFFIISSATILPLLSPSNMFCAIDSSWLHSPCLTVNCLSLMLSNAIVAWITTIITVGVYCRVLEVASCDGCNTAHVALSFDARRGVISLYTLSVVKRKKYTHIVGSQF